MSSGARDSVDHPACWNPWRAVFRSCQNGFTIAKSTIDISDFQHATELRRELSATIFAWRRGTFGINVYFKNMSDTLLLTISAEFMLLMSMVTMTPIIAHLTGWT
jgi:hypothetical protein